MHDFAIFFLFVQAQDARLCLAGKEGWGAYATPGPQSTTRFTNNAQCTYLNSFARFPAEQYHQTACETSPKLHNSPKNNKI